MTHSRSKRGVKFKAMMLLFDNPSENLNLETTDAQQNETLSCASWMREMLNPYLQVHLDLAIASS